MFKPSTSKDIYCQQCKGSCARATSAETQKAARKMFGITPNNCIANIEGKSRCPYIR